MEQTTSGGVYLLTGGNMGDRLFYLAEAKKKIGMTCGNVVAASAVYETAAWGLTDQALFLNQAIHLQTGLSPAKLLDQLLAIEEELGRTRELRYGPRLIDIDILLYGDVVQNEERLRIPHPQLPARRFALQCLADLAAGVVHPTLKKSIGQLLAECTDPLTVNKFS